MGDTKQQVHVMEHAGKMTLTSCIVMCVAVTGAFAAAGLPLVDTMPWAMLVCGVWAAALSAYAGALAARGRHRMVAGMALTMAAFAAALIGIGIDWLGLV